MVRIQSMAFLSLALVGLWGAAVGALAQSVTCYCVSCTGPFANDTTFDQIDCSPQQVSQGYWGLTANGEMYLASNNSNQYQCSQSSVLYNFTLTAYREFNNGTDQTLGSLGNTAAIPGYMNCGGPEGPEVLQPDVVTSGCPCYYSLSSWYTSSLVQKTQWDGDIWNAVVTVTSDAETPPPPSS